MSNRLDGPAPSADRLLWYNLKKRGMKEESLPVELQNSIVKSTRADALGKITVRRMSGLERSPALRVVQRFAEITGGKEDVAEKLEAVEESLSADEKEFVALLRQGGKKSLAHLMAEAAVAPTRILDAYARGCVKLGKIQAAILAGREQPQIVKDLLRHALDQTDICDVCVGSGLVKDRQGSKKETTTCPRCSGGGKCLVVSEHKQFSMGKLMEFNQMTPKSGGPVVNVQQNVGLKLSGGGAFMEKILKTSDEVLYGRGSEVVEAEVVQSETHREEPPTA